MKSPQSSLSNSQFSSIITSPGSGHIIASPFSENVRSNLEFLFYEFMDIIPKSKENSNKDFLKELKKTPDSEAYLAESYFNKLKRPSTNLDSSKHDFDKAFGAGSSRNKFLDALKEYIKKEIKDKFNSEVAEKSFIGEDREAHEILMKKSPFFDLSRQNVNIQNYAREALEELSKLPENQKHLALLDELKQKSGSLELRSFDSMGASSKSSQGAVKSTKEIREILKKDNEYLKSCGGGHLSFEKEETIKRLIEIQKRLDGLYSYDSKSQNSETRSLSQSYDLSRASSFSATRRAVNAFVGDDFNAKQLYDNAQKMMQEIKDKYPEAQVKLNEAKTKSSLQANPQSFAKSLLSNLSLEQIQALRQELGVAPTTSEEQIQALRQRLDVAPTTSDTTFSLSPPATIDSQSPSPVAKVLDSRGVERITRYRYV